MKEKSGTSNSLAPLDFFVLYSSSAVFGGPGVDDFVIIPYKTFAKMYPDVEEVIITVCTTDPKLLPRAQEEVAEVLRRRRNVPANKDNDFEITSPDLLTDLWGNLTGAIVMLTLIIASIGIAIMIAWLPPRQSLAGPALGLLSGVAFGALIVTGQQVIEADLTMTAYPFPPRIGSRNPRARARRIDQLPVAST